MFAYHKMHRICILKKKERVTFHFANLTIGKYFMYIKNDLHIFAILLDSDGSSLALGSRDNFIYVYQVSEEGRKYSRIGRCAVRAIDCNQIDYKVIVKSRVSVYTPL